MMKTLIFLLFCVLSVSSLSPTKAPPSKPPPSKPPRTTCKPCPKSTDPFCETEQAPGTCECLTRCCSIEPCEFGFEYCDSCSHCKCNEGPETTSKLPTPPQCEPCPKSQSNFCDVVQDPDTCECLEQCCDQPYCPNGFEYCDSCSHCKCNEEPVSTSKPPKTTPSCNDPCPQPSSKFCWSKRDPRTCECMTACCAQPYCPNGFEYCDSCSHCKCNEEPVPTPSSSTPEPPSSTNSCNEPCPKSDSNFCFLERDPNTCKCESICCSPPNCPNGFEYCDSCSHCKCKEGPSSPPSSTPSGTCEPCPKSQSAFCKIVQEPETCECLEQCCDQPFCPNGFEYCDSCDHCKCKEETTKRPRKFNCVNV
jgi:hypothetical protein